MGVDSLKTTSGLLDEFTMTVKEAWFGENEMSERASDKLYLQLRGDAFVDGDLEEEDHVELYSLGNGWEVVDEGQGVEHGGGKKQFNRNSGIGRLINAIVDLAEEGEFFDDLKDRPGDTYEAPFWVGMEMSFERQVVSKFKNDDGEWVEWALPLPTSLELGKAKKSSRKPAAKKSSAKADAKAPTERSVRTKVKRYIKANELDDHEEYVDALLEEFPEIEDFDDLHADVLDDESDLFEGVL